MNRKSFLQRIISGIAAFLAIPLLGDKKVPKKFRGFIKGSGATNTVVPIPSRWVDIYNKEGHACLPSIYVVPEGWERTVAIPKQELLNDIASHARKYFQS